ncbi:MAG: ATP-binding protein [Candidatus Bathyarchaeota archaeon]|nr:ATP-binding protein [Candidatus Bathyarchaeota archaeon]
MKQEVSKLDAVPSKRLFLSIIADYDVNRSICELVDNAIDLWVKSGKTKKLAIQIVVDARQQSICIRDNAGGVKKDDMRVIVGPGQTTNHPTDEVIGIFGVGTKRAVVALAQYIKITTRYKRDRTYQVEFDDAWLETDGWDLPLYEVDSIAESTTIIDLQKLRLHITDDVVLHLKQHIRATYAKFLTNDQLLLTLNGEKLQPLGFENWAYPPKYEPRNYAGTLVTEDGQSVSVEVTAGLTLESSPATGEYGVYFYCNDRLIARALKTYNVGFTKGLAGVPHPSLSLARIIVSLKGETQSMPWNSSKSAINPNHQVFVALRDWLVQVVKDYASLSRRLEGDWEEKVFAYPEGEPMQVSISNFPEARKSYLPPLPQSKPRYVDKMKQVNKKIAKEKPWTIGLYESIVAVDLIYNQKLQQKNRICLILLDSTIEIAFKEFLVNDIDLKTNDERLSQLFCRRAAVQKEVSALQKNISYTEWKKIDYYYKMRCKLVHERASVQVSDYEVEDYRRIVETVLHKLFKLCF